MASNSEELARLAELRDKGVLTETEFEAEKGKLLAGSPPIAQPATPAKRRIGCLSIIGALVLIVIVLAFIGAIVKPNGPPPGPAASDATTKPPLPVTAVQLQRAYAANEAAAQRDFGDRPLLVSGTVASVDLDVTDNPVVDLTTENMFQSAQASLVDADKPHAGDLHKGQKVKLLCQSVSEVIGTPMLKDCAFQ